MENFLIWQDHFTKFRIDYYLRQRYNLRTHCLKRTSIAYNSHTIWPFARQSDVSNQNRPESLSDQGLSTRHHFSKILQECFPPLQEQQQQSFKSRYIYVLPFSPYKKCNCEDYYSFSSGVVNAFPCFFLFLRKNLSKNYHYFVTNTFNIYIHISNEFFLITFHFCCLAISLPIGNLQNE